MDILIVEDEAAIREVEVAYLKRAGYATVAAEDSAAALALFSTKSPDAVVIDLNLPGMSGLELCRRIRAQSTVPIIIVTAQTGDDEELQGFQAGADDYVKKPFNPNVLVARVQGLLRRNGHHRLEYGSLIIDPEQMLVTVSGQTVKLTTTQFHLLFTLASQPNVVLSRAQLITKVYSDPAGHDIYDRTIDGHIKSIRKAIEPDPAHPRFIHTVIGSGYRFSPGTT